MKQKIINTLAVAVLFSVGLFSCKKPLEGVNMNFSPDVIKHTIHVKVKDANSTITLPPNAQLTIGGRDAEFVYEIGGKKNFTMHDGTITLGLDPSMVPSESDPVQFTLQLRAPGYLPQEMDVQVYPEQFNQQVTVSMLNPSSPPPGVDIKVQYYKLKNGAIENPAIFMGKTTEDTTYYDDGLTTVVLPKGTTFYHYKWEQTGTYRGVKEPLTMLPDTAYINGEMVIGSVSSPYQDTIDYPKMGWVKHKVTSDDSLIVVCWYASGNDVDVRFTPLNAVSSSPMISTLTAGDIRMDNLLYESAVKKRLWKVQFMAYVNEGGKKVGIEVKPEANTKWFTSYVLDESLINPLTNLPIKEGDSIEIGIDPYISKSTLRTVIKKANNQLRAEAQTVEVGYYYPAIHTYEYSYDFIGQAPSSDVIPDPENLGAWITIDLGVASESFCIWGSGGRYKTSAKVASKHPIKENTASIYLSYCSRHVKDVKINHQGVVNVFNDGSFTGLPPVVTIKARFYCENKKAYVHPSAFFEAWDNTRLFYCNFREGKWRTRGVQVGDYINASGWINNYYFDYPDQKIENNMVLEKNLNGKESICL